MLKITIDNEEVLSNKNFTIEEEMLNTPSVVLDNVYPKSWENDKDYVSRFYHPNDYSKCLIKDENYTPAEPGLNEEGTNFQITADTTKLSELTSMKGNTTQSGTPTPTAPVPINVVSGRQDVVVCGKNMCNPNSNIVNIYFDQSTKNFLYNGNYRSIVIPIKPNTTYTISRTEGYGKDFSLATSINFPTANEYATNVNIKWSASILDSNITTGANDRYLVFYFGYATSLSTCKEWLGKTQLEVGSTATEYEAYKGNTYEINLGKNLISLPSNSRTINGLTGSWEGNTITVSGTNTKTDANWTFLSNGATSVVLPDFKVGEQYTLSTSSKPNGIYLQINYYKNGTTTQGMLGSIGATATKGTFTIPSDFTGAASVFLGVMKTATSVDGTFNIQLEKGSQPTSYSPYKTPIELCKIGNYQDRIYKNGNKWYLEKKIGKVVLKGNDAISYVTYGNNKRFSVRPTNYTNEIYYPGYSPINCINDTFYTNYQATIENPTGATVASLYCHSSGILITMTPEYNVTTSAEMNTFLSTHNTSVYYVLATPTTTEITDSELISQLESIELLEGLNNVSVVSPYLQGIINLHYNFVNEGTTSNLLFCGVVKNSGNISLNPRYPHYQSLQILDFKTFLSEGETLDFVIANKTIEEAIDQIISTISPYGFIKGNIQIIGADTIIGAYSTKDKTAYDVFNYLADITQSRWTTRLIDENTVAIDFYDPTLLPQGTPINYNETWFRDNLIDDMSYSYGSNDYRNKQVMTSNEVYGSILQTQTIVANGYQKQFNTELKIGQITSITANGTQLTIATNEQKELGFNADIYYTPGNNYFESANLRSTGEILIVNYIAIVEGRQIITNGTEINRVATATGRKGIVARYENRNDANTSNELQLIGQSYIRYKGTPEIKLTIVSRKNIWNIGDRVQFNAPINELATEYMVKKKTINRILANPSSEEHIVYTYEMTSSFNSEQAINYFDNQRAKTKGNIGESEYITRNVDIENVANIIFYGSNIEQATITGDNTLQATLSSPIIN